MHGIKSHLQLGWRGLQLISSSNSSSNFTFFLCKALQLSQALSSGAVHRCLYLTTHDCFRASSSAYDQYLIDLVLIILSHLVVSRDTQTQTFFHVNGIISRYDINYAISMIKIKLNTKIEV